MAKLILDDLTSLTNQTSSTAKINTNSSRIEAALENTLSRDGTSPNSMSSSLDMNSHRILNLPAPVSLDDAVRLRDLTTSLPSIVAEGYTFSPGGTLRTLQSRLQDTVSVKDFGAIGDGSTDDSAAFTAALAQANAVYVPWGIYRVKDVVVGDNKVLYGNRAIIKPYAGAVTAAFIMTGFQPYVTGFYFDDGDANIPLTFLKGSVVITNANYSTLTDCLFVNSQNAVIIGGDSHEVRWGNFDNLRIEVFALRGINVGKNVNTCNFTNMRIWAGIVEPDEVPKSGTIGFAMASTGSTIAFGGHFLSNIDCENSEHGFVFTDTNLVSVQNCIASDVHESGFAVTGACDWIKFSDCFTGTCLKGFDVSGTSTDIWIDSASFAGIGVIPSWHVGPADFYAAGSAFAYHIADTASVKIGSWFPDATAASTHIFKDSGATIKFTDFDTLSTGTAASLAGGVTRYLGPGNEQTGETFTFVMPERGFIQELTAQSQSAPAGSETYTYTVRVNGSNTGFIATTTGAAFSSSIEGLEAFAKGDNISIKLVTSASAASSTHRCSIKVKYLS